MLPASTWFSFLFSTGFLKCDGKVAIRALHQSCQPALDLHFFLLVLRKTWNVILLLSLYSDCVLTCRYYLGYSSESTADGLWCISLFLGLLPSLRTVVRGKPLREDRPCTNLALFAWSTSQWNSLFDLFVDGDTRIVLSPRTLAEEEVISRSALMPVLFT